MSDHPDDKTTRTRDGKGRYDRDPATAQRDAEAARMRARSMTYQQIADALSMSKSAAHEAVQRALADTLEEPAAAVRQMELEKLDALERAVLAVLERKHVTVSHGRVVMVDDEPLEDDGPVLAAVDRLVKIAERRARLLGLDAEKRVNLSGGVTYEIVGVSSEDLT